MPGDVDDQTWLFIRESYGKQRPLSSRWSLLSIVGRWLMLTFWNNVLRDRCEYKIKEFCWTCDWLFGNTAIMSCVTANINFAERVTYMLTLHHFFWHKNLIAVDKKTERSTHRPQNAEAPKRRSSLRRNYVVECWLPPKNTMLMQFFFWRFSDRVFQECLISLWAPFGKYNVFGKSWKASI